MFVGLVTTIVRNELGTSRSLQKYLTQYILWGTKISQLTRFPIINEMVCLGDTAIRLHILLQPQLVSGVFWVRSDLESRKKIRVFNFGGGTIWVRSDLESRKNLRVCNFQGGAQVFWVRSDLDSGKNFIFGGCSGTKSQYRGTSGEFWYKDFWKPSLQLHHR